MADVMPDYRISIQKVKSEIAQLRFREENHKLQLMELVARRDQIMNNWEAEKEAIAAKLQTLSDLEQAHGVVDDAVLEDAKTTKLIPKELEE